MFNRFESDGYCKSSLLVLMASVSPMNVVLPSRLVAYLLSFLPLYLPLVSSFLPQSDIGLLQVRVHPLSPRYLQESLSIGPLLHV
jgi:hypothetical protein